MLDKSGALRGHLKEVAGAHKLLKEKVVPNKAVLVPVKEFQ